MSDVFIVNSTLHGDVLCFRKLPGSSKICIGYDCRVLDGAIKLIHMYDVTYPGDIAQIVEYITTHDLMRKLNSRVCFVFNGYNRTVLADFVDNFPKIKHALICLANCGGIVPKIMVPQKISYSVEIIVCDVAYDEYREDLSEGTFAEFIQRAKNVIVSGNEQVMLGVWKNRIKKYE